MRHSLLALLGIALLWVSSCSKGGGGGSSVAVSYDLRCASSAIDASNWAAALELDEEPAPAFAGLPQSMVLTGTPPDTVVYFAIRACSQTGV